MRDGLVGTEWLDAMYDKMAAGAHAQPGKVRCGAGRSLCLLRCAVL
jgi:hypothetical protein